MNQIHPTAVVDPGAKLGDHISVGPFCVIEEGVTVGDHCELACHVVLKGKTSLGQGNIVEDGAILGGRPQHLAQHEPGDLIVGSHNTIRENVTIHAAMTHTAATRIGDHNLIMVNAHVAHDCQIGHHTILANNVMLAGHVSVADYAYLSGAVGVHQFCRVGAHAMVGGQSHVTKDIPPYVTVDGQTTRIVGLNLIGLRRRGFTSDEILQLKAAYRVIYRQGLTWREVLERLQDEFQTGPAAAFSSFFLGGKRGFTLERRTPPEAMLPIPDPVADSEHGTLRKVG